MFCFVFNSNAKIQFQNAHLSMCWNINKQKDEEGLLLIFINVDDCMTRLNTIQIQFSPNSCINFNKKNKPSLNVTSGYYFFFFALFFNHFSRPFPKTLLLPHISELFATTPSSLLHSGSLLTLVTSFLQNSALFRELLRFPGVHTGFP